MTKALYSVRYVGEQGHGYGATYIGNGQILGIVLGDIVLRGTYSEKNGRVQIQAKMISKSEGTTIVTGNFLPRGASEDLEADWPIDFTNGQELSLQIGGRPIIATFEKIGEIT